MAGTLLSIDEITASYGEAQALFGVSLRVSAGQAVSLMGRNGMGKSTTIKVLMGMVPLTGGAITFAGEPLRRKRAYHIARLGVGLVPEGRQIFSALNVKENLLATARGQGPWTLSKVYSLFPRLMERQHSMGNQLSGGEQQMLAIGRALMTNPKLLILDEATEGLAPLVREEIWRTIGEIRSTGQSIIVVDKDMAALSKLCDHHFVLERGRTVWEGDSASFAENAASVSKLLSI
ncbi:ABC transporter ATP-binding protein [Pusillimonas sp.]|uniref:ABC transporter ATP-binding protein n=1 Tax=Pusillimonas sp. TaxID=3040095 RepID=UPI0029A8B34B|nr:ABC transporter ATP-binding protein [Pusillimonas sp.]MDX3895572.1 ABC transporter ATP-binding protein [Pusillimonas sp.]